MGVLSVQGDVLEHLRVLTSVGAVGVPVAHPADLGAVDAMVLPGGESTAIGKMLHRFGLLPPLRDRITAGMPVLGTCAGAILLGTETLLADGRVSDQHLLGVLDCTTRRNAFGRQVASFEGSVDVDGLEGGPMHGVFIRAPWFEQVGSGVEVLATVDTPLGAKVVVVQQGTILACAFHPELSADDRLHRRLVGLATRTASGEMSTG